MLNVYSGNTNHHYNNYHLWQHFELVNWRIYHRRHFEFGNLEDFLEFKYFLDFVVWGRIIKGGGGNSSKKNNLKIYQISTKDWLINEHIYVKDENNNEKEV